MKFIADLEVFLSASEKILSSSWAAVDTEADSLHHYSEKLSLVQITTPDGDYVIDPLVPLPLADFFSKLSQKDLIFHAADSDIRLLKKSYFFAPRQIFDTMIAAQLLGYPKIGLADLAERHCGIRLSKAEQKADWSARPLEQKLIDYAVNDTHYLKEISDKMRDELHELGRLEWHTQQCAKLLETLAALKPDETDRSLAWQIKGAKNLKGKELTLLKEFWTWRERLAEERDKPPFKILNSEYLLQMAQWAGQNPGVDIAQWSQAPRNVRGEHRADLNRIISSSDALRQAVLDLPKKNLSRQKWTDKENKILSEFKAAREKLAAEFKLGASLIATNAILENLTIQKPATLEQMAQSGMMLPWQIQVAGNDFLKVLNQA